ncbi:MAG: B12-binding domain-containing radical SAM protein [Desulfuromonas sp.]|nr:MAG: B12-binding domain-containing radical SAM protein [Desulfuromonas sp.]
MKKIVLINPAYRSSMHSNIRILALPPLNLQIIAAHTPERFTVEIIDEALEEIDFEQPVDLVGITCMTPMAPRAYEIASEYRKRGVPVVIGGIHASIMHDEAKQFCDAVVVGEGEQLWPQLLEDFELGSLQPLYTMTERPDITHLPMPRRDLSNNDYFVQTVQTSRGCPHNCKFCSVTMFNGGKYRMRDIDNVIDELESLEAKRIFIIDDNILGPGKQCIERAFELFNRMKGLGKEWGGQTCLNIVEHDGLLKAAHDSGARAFLIGFESLQPHTLSAMKKNMNLRPNTSNFKDAIKKIQDHGIAIVGGFIFGTDDDTMETYERTLEFIHDSGIDAVQLTIQTPLPGTALYRELQEQGRLLRDTYPADWEAYNIFEPVFQPKHMSPEELYSGLIDAYREVASFKRSLPRGLKTFWRTRSLFSTSIAFFWNHDSYKTISAITNPQLGPPA